MRARPETRPERPYDARLLRFGPHGQSRPLRSDARIRAPSDHSGRVSGQARRPVGRRDAGFALLIVLWSLALLALLGTMLVGWARSEAQLTLNRRAEAAAIAADDAAISNAILDVLRHQITDAKMLKFGPAEVAIRLENLSGRLNPNIANVAMLQELLLRVGAPPPRAPGLAAAIIDWRTPGLTPSPHGAKAAAYRAAGRSFGPPGRPFEHLSELGDVLGMTPAVLAALIPHLTLWTTNDPDPEFADALVLAALRAGGAPPVAAPQGEAQVIAITAQAHMADAPALVRRAVIRFGYSPDGRGWRVLSWE